uniref:Putative ATP synthase delta chain n=1 Tax=Davidia involucrata TaxID=16924 RepID=A0A5B7AQJ7_DAVIN
MTPPPPHSADVDKVEKIFSDPQVYDFFANPTIDIEKKRKVIDEMASAHPEIRFGKPFHGRVDVVLHTDQLICYASNIAQTLYSTSSTQRLTKRILPIMVPGE